MGIFFYYFLEFFLGGTRHFTQKIALFRGEVLGKNLNFGAILDQNDMRKFSFGGGIWTVEFKMGECRPLR